MYTLLCALTLCAIVGQNDNLVDNDSVDRDQVVKEVVVTGLRNSADSRHVPMNITTITNEILNEDYRTSILPTLTEEVPGMFSTSRGVMGYGVATGSAGTMKIRGVGGDSPNGGVLVLIDGMPQYTGLLGHSISDVSQTVIAEKVEVLSGPASVIYGSNAMGGVVNIVTRGMMADGCRTSVRIAGGSYGTVEGQATNMFRKGKLESTVGASYSHTDGHRANSDFDQYVGFAKLAYTLTPSWKIIGDVNVTGFNSSTPGQVQLPYIDYDQDILRGTTSLRLTNNYERFSGALVAFYNWGHHEINDGYHPGGTPQTKLYMHNDLMGGVSLYESMSLGARSVVTVGVDWHILGGRAWNEGVADGKETTIVDKTETEMAGYATLQQGITPNLDLNIGIRLDHHSVSGTEWVPQGGLVWRLGGAELKAMVSKGFRNPTIREMYMFPPQNPDLKPERLVNYEIGYLQKFMDGRLTLGADIYYLDGENLITTKRIDGKPLNVNVNDVENYGAEVKASFTCSKKWRFNANYSYLNMKTPVVAAPEHKFYAGANFSGGRFSASAGMMLVGGLYTQVGTNEQKETYTLLHLTCNYRLADNVSVYAKGDNLLAQKYETLYGYPMPRATFMGGLTLDF